MKVRDVMTKDIVTASPQSTVRELWKQLFSRHVNAIPVVDAKRKLLGIITKEDLLKALYPDYEEYMADITGLEDFEAMENKVRELGSKKATSVMCKRVVYTREGTELMRALSRMIVRRLNQLPVLSAQDAVVGVVTKGDVFYALFKKNLDTKTAKASKRGK